MLHLYNGSGCADFERIELIVPFQEFSSTKKRAIQWLDAAKNFDAAKFLDKYNFEIYSGSNVFNDHFCILYADVPYETYIQIDLDNSDQIHKRDLNAIANIISQISPYYIRHIAIGFSDDDPILLETPPLKHTSEILEKALKDGHNLLLTSGAEHAIDRIHTAFHEFLLSICKKANITTKQNDNVIILFKSILTSHSNFQSMDENTKKILRSLSAIVDALNTNRNKRSLAHPNKLLTRTEAVLMINTISTLFHYLDSVLHVPVTNSNQNFI